MAEPSVLWESISSGALSAIGAIGGFAFLAKSFFNFISSMVAKKIDANNAKELEKLRTTLGNKTYISKVRFDTEFAIYRDLSATFFDATYHLNRIIPQDLELFKNPYFGTMENYEKAYELTAEKMELARDTLLQNAPFIDEEIYNLYSELIEIVAKEVVKFACSHNLKYSTGLFPENSLDKSDAEITAHTIQELKAINNKVRSYLKTLEVIE